MARRPPRRRRPERTTDPLEVVKPLLVLGLLGMILYGAYSLVQKAPAGGSAEWQLPDTPTNSLAEGMAPPFQAGPIAPPIAMQSPPTMEATPSALPGEPTTNPPAPPAEVAFAPPLATTAPAAPATTAPSMETVQAITAVPPPAQPASTPESVSESPPSTYLSAVPAMPPASAASAIAADHGQANGSLAFSSAWSDAHQKLEAGRYAEALSMLTVWYDDPGLSPEESQRLDDLLSQLAGTVIYSAQDLLLAPHVVAPGETLESIAAPLEVPWQLLAKINGLEPAAPLQPQALLKVIRGPFDAVVSVSRRKLSLQVAGHYAGRFDVVIGQQVAARIGTSVPVVQVRHGSGMASDATADRAMQVAYLPPGRGSILLGDAFSIEPAEDPAVVAETVPATSILVSAHDFSDIVDILGAGSQVLIRQ